MTKELKKSNEGFSLVELIIVIAIMAILVGVVALQVVPYMEKSREGKDMSQLDSCFSAFQTSVAEAEISGDIAAWKYGSGAANSDAGKIDTAMKASLGMDAAALKAKLGSKNVSGCDLYLEKKGTTITVAFSETGVGAPAKGEYNKKDYKITSGTAATTTGGGETTN